MLFQPEDKTPRGTKQTVPLGMIGQAPVELKRNIFQMLIIWTPDYQLDVSDETPAGINQKLKEMVQFYVKRHPELLYKR